MGKNKIKILQKTVMMHAPGGWGRLRTKPPKVKLPGLLPPSPALWAIVSVLLCASQAAWKAAAVGVLAVHRGFLEELPHHDHGLTAGHVESGPLVSSARWGMCLVQAGLYFREAHALFFAVL